MFAGLPGFGVGTLFYIVVALWMPFRELPRVVQGTSSFARWRLIARQLTYAVGIILTIMIAERLLLWLLGHAGPQPFSPALLLSRELTARPGDSILAAPIMASLLLLAGVVLSIEILRLIVTRRPSPRTASRRLSGRFPEEALDSPGSN
jgi:hypothetical protein